MKNKILLLSFGLVLAGALVALTGRSFQPQVSAQGGNQVTITNYKFEPKKLTINEGDSVTWVNKEGVHTVKSDTDIFISKTIKAGENFSYQFTKAGTYPYHCSFHGSSGGGDMSGTIVVVKKK